MTPAQYVAQVLLVARQRGWDFEDAWSAAVRSLPRPGTTATVQLHEWRDCLKWAKPAYEAAYHKAPAPRLVSPEDAVPVPDDQLLIAA